MKWGELAFWESQRWTDIQKQIGDVKDLCPHHNQVFKALAMTPLERVKAVILGQDPYHGGQATGLAFSVHPFVKVLPPSLRNILKEYSTDLHLPPPMTGDLSAWARQGVLLWNTIPTTVMGKPLAHRGMGWELLTKEIMYRVLQSNPAAVFLLWGKEAQQAVESLQIRNRLETSHPSPYAAAQGFFGCNHFSRANALLRVSGQSGIDWRLY